MALLIGALTGGYKLSADPSAPGVEFIGGARLIVAPRVTMRVDYAPMDPAAFYVLKPS